MNPRASFVIPAYNADLWISKTLWSCRNQTEKKIEILVVNDASTDSTQEIIEWHAKEDPRVKLIDFSDNGGQSRARNEGNQQAQADYLFVLDADDMAARNRVKDSLAAFTLKGCDLVYGSFFKMDSNGTVCERVPVTPFDPEFSRKAKTNRICHSTLAYTRKVAQNVQYQWAQFGSLGIDDWRFEWDCYRKGYTFQPVKSPLSYYRSLESSMTMNRDPKLMNEFKDAYLATF